MTFVVTANRIPAAMAALEAKAGRAVAKAAMDLKSDAVQRAPIDTGNLRASGYARAVARLTWQVGFTAHYALYVELGTYKMRAQPYLLPAFNVGTRRLADALRGIGLLG